MKGYFDAVFTPIMSRIVVKEFFYSYSTTVELKKTFLLKDESTRKMFNSNRNQMLRLCYWTRITLINRVKVCCWHWFRKITLQIFEVILLLILIIHLTCRKLDLKTVLEVFIHISILKNMQKLFGIIVSFIYRTYGCR